MNFTDLPEEIIAYIFSFYVKTEGHVKLMSNLSQVCSKWNLALMQPALWRTIACKSEPKTRRGDLYQLLRIREKGLLAHTRKLSITNQALTVRVYPALFNGCTNLTDLILSKTRVDRDFFTYVAMNCPNISSLSLHQVNDDGFTMCADTLVPAITACGSKLKYLKLSGISIREQYDMMTDIAENCPLLEELHSDVSLLRDGMCSFPVAKFQYGCPNVRVLNLEGCSFDSVGAEGTSGFPKLEALVASYRMDDVDLNLILNTSKNLKSLHIWCYPRVTCECLLTIPCEKLKKLSLDGPMLSSPYLYEAILRWRSTLEEISFFYMSAVFVEIALAALVYYDDIELLRMKVLGLVYSDVRPSVLKDVIMKCPELNAIDLRGCKSLPPKCRRVYTSPEQVRELYGKIEHL